MLFIAGLGLTVPALVGVVKDYYNYPITTKVKVKTADNATFPAVTICGLNRFSKPFFKNLSIFKQSPHSRINCMELYNLIQEYALNISMHSLTSEAESEESNETLSLLKNIYEQTRCKQQYCNEVPDMVIPGVYPIVFFKQFEVTATPLPNEYFSQVRFDSSKDDIVLHEFGELCWLDLPYEDMVCFQFQPFSFSFNHWGNVVLHSDSGFPFCSEIFIQENIYVSAAKDKKEILLQLLSNIYIWL